MGDAGQLDYILRGVGYQDRPEVSGPDVPLGEAVGLIRVPITLCPDCNPGDSGCDTCGDHNWVRAGGESRG